MQAIISDIHANVEALTSVLEDIHTAGAEEVVCLGDIVGYGADPKPCIDMVRKHCRFCVQGNHDYAVLNVAEHFNPLAEEAIDFARKELKPSGLSLLGKKARWHFLEGLPLRKREMDVLYVHGSPRDERNEYILETDILFGNVEKIRDIFDAIPRICFVGHSHVPGIITEEMEFITSEDCAPAFPLEDGTDYIINVGSVGQPRDGDNRACYVVFDGNEVKYRRVEYDFRAAMKKIEDIGPISRNAAIRLEQGR